MRDWKTDLDIWLTSVPDPGEDIECPDCGDDGAGPDPYCTACDGTGWTSEDALRMRDYDRAEDLRADEWRNEQ